MQVSAYDSTLDTEKRIAALHSCLGDIHRVGELAENVTKYTPAQHTEKDQLYFSPKDKDDIKGMYELLEKMSEKAGELLLSGAMDDINAIDELENEVDSRRKRPHQGARR